MADFIELTSTCVDQAEAGKIADVLLEKHLVACVKFEPVHSKYWWESQLVEGDEIKLTMLSTDVNFDKIEAEVAKLHSYETFVLQATIISNVSKGVVSWLLKEIRS